MAKYIDAGKLKYEIERRKLSNYYTDTDDYEAELFEIIEEQPEVNLENPVPNDLEEAAEEYLQKVKARFLRTLEHPTAKDCFIAGAKWQKSQMLKEAVEVRVQRSPLNGPLEISAYCCNFPSNHPFYHCKEGDKVKVIIVKEN